LQNASSLGQAGISIVQDTGGMVVAHDAPPLRSSFTSRHGAGA
jgi:hypothetical protein